MFESAEIAHDIDKTTFEEQLPQLRTDILNAQFELIETKAFPTILLFSGMEGTGVVDTLTNAYTVLDARHVVVSAFDKPTEEESERPRMWRYWRMLPPRGELGIYIGAWYNAPLTNRILNKSSIAEYKQELERIKRFESMLASEGALILKFWLHLGKGEQKKRLKKLGRSARTSWRVEESPWGGSKRYQEVKLAAEDMMRRTGTDHAPWIAVNAANRYSRGLTILTTVLNAINARLARGSETAAPVTAPVNVPILDGRNVLTALDLSLQLEKEDYKKQLARYQDRLNELLSRKKFRKRSLVLVFEGNDAAGKGGAIRRVIQFMDPRRYRVNQFAAPTDEEKAQPYLWRFWRRLPRQGDVALFDRSWYGRVLVERVENFCSEADWRRAYSEINDFEAEMSDAGAIVVKFWLAIDRDEQEARFKAREETGYKRYKITDEDWRNREKWDEYTMAVCDMVDQTSTSTAPWTLVEANNKYHARVKVLKTICGRLEESL
ncbi:MAG: polyphosphate:AMP phosphotransferase [Gammaproteobacteria bacterium]|jgi:polyphosphate:AMP phosphotransferase|nr:polyphosphate:AMP phosphotransferase [Gammaproteobacteria bacterium]